MPRKEIDIAAAQAVIELLSERWPKAFAVFERRRRPLKLGIHVDILTALEGAVTPAELTQALRLYTRNTGYSWSMVRAGADRVDLNGDAAGTVTEADADHARFQLKQYAAYKVRQAARKARQAAAASQPTPMAGPVEMVEPAIAPAAPMIAPAATPVPKRIGLADLREAARARRAREQQAAV